MVKELVAHDREFGDEVENIDGLDVPSEFAAIMAKGRKYAMLADERKLVEEFYNYLPGCQVRVSRDGKRIEETCETTVQTEWSGVPGPPQPKTLFD